MKASKFSEAQKVFILKQGNDGMPVPEVCRKAGISQATYFNWKRKAGCCRRKCGGAQAARGTPSCATTTVMRPGQTKLGHRLYS